MTLCDDYASHNINNVLLSESITIENNKRPIFYRMVLLNGKKYIKQQTFQSNLKKYSQKTLTQNFTKTSNVPRFFAGIWTLLT